MKLSGKIVLITGANGVIGRTIARACLAEGATVILVGRSLEALEKVRQELVKQPGTPIGLYTADVSVRKDVEQAMANVQAQYGRLDVLVTAAGVYGEIGTLEQCDPEQWAEAIRVNLIGTMLCVKYAWPLLKQSAHGKVITFAGGGDGALPNFTSYASSKGAVLRFTESVAQELAPLHIDINAISPGLVNSGFVEDLIVAGPERVGQEKYDAAVREVASEANTVSPDKAAALAVFLASEESNGLTGKNISAVWDAWQDIPKHLDEIMKGDVYNWRRIKPKDRGYDW